MIERQGAVAAAGLVALAVAIGIGRFAFTPLLPMMQSDAGLTVAQGGWLASANYVGYLLGGLSAGALHIAGNRAIRIALAAVTLSTLAMALTTNMAAWILLRGIAGVASAWVLVFTSAWCLERFQAADAKRRGVLGAIVFAGVGTGIAVTGALCALLLAAHAGSVTAWIVLGVASLAASIPIWPRVGSTAAGAAAPASGTRWSMERVRMVLCYGAFGFGYIIPATFLSAMAREAASGSPIYAWSWPAFGAAGAASTLVATRLASRWNERAVWIASYVLMASGVLAPLLLAGVAGIVLSALLVGGTFMVATMAGIQDARRVAGATARPLIAAMTSSFAVGQIAGPLAVGALASRGHGYAPALVAAAALLLAAAAALLPRLPETTP